MNDELYDLMKRIEQSTQEKPIPSLEVTDAHLIAEGYNAKTNPKPLYQLTYIHVLTISKKLTGLSIGACDGGAPDSQELNNAVSMLSQYLENYHLRSEIEVKSHSSTSLSNSTL